VSIGNPRLLPPHDIWGNEKIFFSYILEIDLIEEAYK
jgi:hypothetical protein